MYRIWFKHQTSYNKNSKGILIRNNQNKTFAISFKEKPKSFEPIASAVLDQLGHLPKGLKILDKTKNKFVSCKSGGIDW